MKIQLLNYTPLSVSVIAGRTAWDSFHKGGNYENPTDDISKNDINFLMRLFRKFKHLSVADHIWYEFKLKVIPIEKLQYLTQGYYFFKIEDDNMLLQCNLRFLIENENNENTKDLINELIDTLPEKHQVFFDENKIELFTRENDDGIKISNETDLIHLTKMENQDIYHLSIKNISRALLQELMRHDDMLGATVKSTRYTLKELKDEKDFVEIEKIEIPDNERGLTYPKFDFERASKYIKLTGNKIVDSSNVTKIDQISKILRNEKISNDILKFLLPEAYLTGAIISIPKRNFENLLKLRLSKDALWEFQELAQILEKFKRKD